MHYTYNNLADVNSALTNFYNLLYSMIDRSVARVRRSHRTYPPWFDSNARRLRKLKEKIESYVFFLQ